ncbi:MAG: SRPBCC family protein [Flavobacteriales bacterium]
MTGSGNGTNTITTERVVNAKRERVFEAWTDPVVLARWWGPKGFTNIIEHYDLRPGGYWDLIMHGPDGKDYHNHSVFVEVVVAERIVFDHVEPIHRFRTTVTFEDLGDKTRILWRMAFASKEEYTKVSAFITAANEENLDKLEHELS